jgi:non-specific protein-tyrosine kinase
LIVGQALQDPNPNADQFSLGQALAQSYADLVKREPVMRGTLDELNLPWNWLDLQSMVTSRVIPGTQLVEISVLDTEPKRAKTLVETIADQLIKQSPAGTDPEREAQREFILSQIDYLKNNIESSNAEIRQLDEVIAKANSARQIQDARSRQSALQAQISTWQSTYAQLLSNLQQGSTNFLSIVERAQVPAGPTGSGTAANVLLAAAIGLVLAAGAAFLIEYLDDTLKTSEDIRQAVSLTTLGSIPLMAGLDANDKLITLHQPRSPAAEAYRMLRTNLQFSFVDDPLRVLVITSCSPGEGKSVTASNIAVVMAQSGLRTILVDADLRRPIIHEIFVVSNSVGLTSMLLNGNLQLSQTLQATSTENLHILTSGPVPPNPSEMIGSKRMRSLLEALKEEADIIVVDSPPVMAVSDTAVLAANTHGSTLLVIDAGHTRRGAARHSKDALAAVNATPLGVVLNRAKLYNRGYARYSGADTSHAEMSLRERLERRFKRKRSVGENIASPGVTSPEVPAEGNSDTTVAI